ncbi:MAG TPA: AsmA family protein [Rhizobiales bacterium]|nr:AsmA family protein [Hyphomicrobiales bacterium]
MASNLARYGLWIVGGMLVVAAALIAALPYIASAQIVRDRIALEVSAWSGYRVELGAAPEIEVWPFRAVLREVVMSGWFDPERRPVITAETVEIDLSPLAALRGEVLFSTARLVRPTIRLASDAGDADLSTSPVGGRIARSIEEARKVVARDPVNPDVSALPRDPFGTIQVIDGRIVAARSVKDEDIVSSVTGSFDWAALDRPLRLSMTGIWRGESVSLDIAAARPLVLFAGGTGPLSMSLKSAPASFYFDGTASLSGDTFFAGSARFTSPSLRRTIEWSAPETATGSPIGVVSIEGRISGNRQRLKLEETRISIDGNSGTGVIELALAEQIPALSGTLAFKTLDLRSFLSAFGVAETPSSLSAGVDLANRVDLDLRLSAERATSGPIALEDLAATARVKRGHAAFDISDAAAFGGNVQASIRIDGKAEGEVVEIRFVGDEVDGGVVAAFAPVLRILPTAKGNISAMIRAPAGPWKEVLAKGEGSFSAHFGEGVIQKLDMTSFLERLAKGDFFALDDVATDSLAVNDVEIKATVSKGVARLAKAEIRTANSAISLSGIIPSVGGLALSGSIILAGDAKSTNPPGISFFVGGSWSKPFVVPVPAAPTTAD